MHQERGLRRVRAGSGERDLGAEAINLALLAAAATGVQVGAAIVASRFAVAEVPPLTLAMLRYAIGFLCLLPFAWRAFPGATRDPHPSVGPNRMLDLFAMAALGIGQFGVLIALLNYGLQHIGAAQAALIFSLFPLLTLLLSAALGRERVTPSLLLGVLISIAGVALALSPKLGESQAGHWRGELAVVAAACTGALCSVLYRPYLQRYPTVPVSAFAMLASVLFLALLALGEQWPARIGGFSAQALAAVTFIGISSGVGYFWWLYALKHESPTRVTVFLALNPVTAALLGWALLGEALHPALLGALTLIGTGLWLAARPACRQHDAPPRIIDGMSSSHEASAEASVGQRPRPKSLTDLFLSFTFLALQGFGGVLAVVQRELVEKKRWMTRDEFVEEWAVAQIMPGPNVVNLSLMLGDRYFGWRGAMVALAGMLTVPLLVVLCLALVYAQYADNPHVAGALRGMGAVAAGLITATGMKLLGAIRKNPLGVPLCIVFGVASFIGIALLRLPLAWVLLGLGGLSCVLTYRKMGKTGA